MGETENMGCNGANENMDGGKRVKEDKEKATGGVLYGGSRGNKKEY